MKNRVLPGDIVDNWPDIFNDIEVTAIPFKYLDSLTISFKDGRAWVFDIAKHIKEDNDLTALEDHLCELIDNYEDSIENIDLKLDVKRVKKDITSKTKSFLKNTYKK